MDFEEVYVDFVSCVDLHHHYCDFVVFVCQNRFGTNILGQVGVVRDEYNMNIFQTSTFFYLLLDKLGLLSVHLDNTERSPGSR